MACKIKYTQELTEEEQRIVDAANELMQAVQAAGYSIRNTDDMSGVEVCIYHSHAQDISINNILAGWHIFGKNTKGDIV